MTMIAANLAHLSVETGTLSTNENRTQELSNNISSSIITNIEFPSLHHQQQQSNDDKLLLRNAWGTYFYKADKQRDWKQNVIYITSINYVEDFWSFYTHTYGLRDLTNGSDYMFFKVKFPISIDR